MSGGLPEQFLLPSNGWLREVLTTLSKDQARVARSFRGNTETSLDVFLASIAVFIVVNHRRSQDGVQKTGEYSARSSGRHGKVAGAGADLRVSDLLDLIDLQASLQGNGDPDRDLLIFKLYFVEGLTAKEIASIPSFNLEVSDLERVLNRLQTLAESTVVP